jgi:hypothetical protein
MERPVNGEDGTLRSNLLLVHLREAWQVPVRRLARRLITLIFAGRNRMVVIRRELPRTKSAGRAA